MKFDIALPCLDKFLIIQFVHSVLDNLKRIVGATRPKITSISAVIGSFDLVIVTPLLKIIIAYFIYLSGSYN